MSTLDRTAPDRLFTRRHALIMLLITTLLIGVYWFTYSGTPISNDELFLFDGAAGLVRRGSTEVTLLADKRVLSRYSVTDLPLTPPVDAEPMQLYTAAAIFAVAEAVPGIGLAHSVWLLNAFICALGGAVLFFYGRALGYGERPAIAAALVYGVGTIAWPYSKTFFREPLAMLLLFTAGLCLHMMRIRWGRRISWGWLAGFAAFFLAALLTKEAAMFAIPVYIAITFPAVNTRFNRTQVLRFVLIALAVGAVLFIALQIALQVLPTMRGYNPLERLAEISGKGEFIGYAFLSYTFSPGRSFFAFSPALLLILPGAWLLIRQRRIREAVIPLLAVFLFIAGYAVVRHENWFGGLAWGPRYLVPAVLFASLGMLPVLEALFARRLPRWASLSTWSLIAISVWVQLTGILLRQSAYFAEVNRRGLIAWEGATWNPGHAPALVVPGLLPDNPLDFAWLRAADAGLWLPITALLLVVGAVWGLWRLRRETPLSRRGLIAAALVLLVSTGGSLYLGLRSIYADPEYLGDQAKLHDLLPIMDAQFQADDILILTNTAYKFFFLNYYREQDIPAYTLPAAPGEQPSPDQPPGIINNNPDRLLEAQRSIFLLNLPEYTDRVWLMNNSGPFTGYTVRPVEWFMARHYFPLATYQTDESARLVLFYVGSDAPPDQAMAWPEHAVNARFGDEVALLGVDMPPPRVRVGPFSGPDPARTSFRPGEVVPVSLLWEALDVPTSDYNVGVFLLNAGGEVIAQQDGPPQATFRPMTSWDAGETVRDNHALQLPEALPAGEYQLWVKVYAWQTGEPLPVTGEDRTEDGQAAWIATITVE